jgi:hypothetical protein
MYSTWHSKLKRPRPVLITCTVHILPPSNNSEKSKFRSNLTKTKEIRFGKGFTTTIAIEFVSQKKKKRLLCIEQQVYGTVPAPVRTTNFCLLARNRLSFSMSSSRGPRCRGTKARFVHSLFSPSFRQRHFVGCIQPL